METEPKPIESGKKISVYELEAALDQEYNYLCHNSRPSQLIEINAVTETLLHILELTDNKIDSPDIKQAVKKRFKELVELYGVDTADKALEILPAEIKATRLKYEAFSIIMCFFAKHYKIPNPFQIMLYLGGKYFINIICTLNWQVKRKVHESDSIRTPWSIYVAMVSGSGGIKNYPDEFHQAGKVCDLLLNEQYGMIHSAFPAFHWLAQYFETLPIEQHRQFQKLKEQKLKWALKNE